jgi:hypothetical protein
MDSEELAPEWSKIYDELSGQYYYCNNVTWEVSWDPPSTKNNESEQLSEAEVQQRALEAYYQELDGESEEKYDSESAWIEQFDESSNSTYYYNTVTGDTAWELPEGVTIQTASTDQAAADESSEQPASQSNEYRYGYYNEDGEYVYDYDADPQYWTSAYDESSGAAYYYNTATGTTQWDVPACFQQPAEETAKDTSADSLYASISSHIPFQDSHQTLFTTNKTTKRSKRHSISGPMHGKVDLTDLKSSSSFHASAVEQPRQSIAQFFPKDKISSILKHSRTHESTASSPTISEHKQASSSAPSSSSAEDIHKAVADLNPEELGNIVIKIIDLRSLSPTSSIEQISKLVKGLSVMDYLKSQHLRFKSYADAKNNKFSAYSESTYSSFSWSPRAMSHPNLILSSKEEIMTAKKCHRYILKFMENSSFSSSGRAGDVTMKLLNCAKHWIQNHPSSYLADEIYVHLCKQLTNNPAMTSTQRGWMLLQLLLATFLPSLDCFPYILAHCLDAFVKIGQDLSSASPTATTALLEMNLHQQTEQPLSRVIAATLLCCLKAMEFVSMHLTDDMLSSVTMSSSPAIMNAFLRQELPSAMEVQALWSGKAISIHIHLLIPDRLVVVPCDSWTTIRRLNQEIAEELGLSAEHDSSSSSARSINHILSDTMNPAKDIELNSSFYLFELSLTSERCLPLHSRAVDVINSSLFQTHAQASQRLVYKIRYYLDSLATISSNQMMRELYYYQAADDVLRLKYPIFEYDAYILAAYHAYVLGISPTSSAECLHPSFVSDRSNKLIEGYHHRLTLSSSQRSIEDVQLSYLSIVSSWKLYGSTTFTVESRTELGTPSVLLLAVNGEGITLVHIESKAFLAVYRYDGMLSWGHSHNFFLIVTGTKMQPIRQYFKTTSGKDIDEVVNVYVDIYRKRQGKDQAEDDSILQPIVFEKSIFSVNVGKLPSKIRG